MAEHERNTEPMAPLSQVRRAQMLALVSLCLAACNALGLTGARRSEAKGPGKTVRAPFRVVDAKGRTVFEIVNHGGPRREKEEFGGGGFGGSGRRLVLPGPMGELSLYGPDDNPLFRVRTDRAPDHSFKQVSTEVEVATPQGETRVKLWAMPGYGRVIVTDSSGEH